MDEENNEVEPKQSKVSPKTMFYIYFIGSIYFLLCTFDWIRFFKEAYGENNIEVMSILKFVFVLWLLIMFVINAIKYNKERKKLENQ